MNLEIFEESYAEYQAHEEELTRRVEAWIKIRFLIAYLLFGSIFLYRPSLNLPFPVVPLLATLLLIIVFNGFSFMFLAYGRKWVNYLAYTQVGIDFIIVTLVYQITGGVDSPFDWIYLYVILAAGLVGAWRFSLLLSLLSLLSVAFVLWAQYNFLLPHFQVGLIATHSPSGFHDVKLIVSEIISNGVMFISLGLISGYIADLAENRRRKLGEAYQLLKQHKEKVLQAITVTQEDERKRIARELHDQTGQSLTVLISNLQVLESKLASQPEPRKQLASLRQLGENLLDEVHNIIFDLRPSVLDDLGVIASLKWYVRTYVEPLGINVEIFVIGDSRRLDEKREVFLYRFLQEALSNILKHAQATELMIMFRFNRETLHIEVQDNGVGFDASGLANARSRRWGLVGMKERIELLQGKLHIKSEPGSGTCLSVIIPLQIAEDVLTS